MSSIRAVLARQAAHLLRPLRWSISIAVLLTAATLGSGPPALAQSTAASAAAAAAPASAVASAPGSTGPA